MLHKTLLFMLFVVYFLSENVLSNPISVKSVNSGDQTEQKKSNLFANSAENGNSGGKTTSGFNEQNEKNHVISQDSGAYNNINKDSKQHHNSGEKFGENFHQQNAGSVSQTGRQGGHRKGHRKSGFQNSYHKEESENNSSYYDDSDDNGGHFAYNTQNGGYGTTGGNKNYGSFQDASLHSTGNSQKGMHDNGGNYYKNKGDKTAYNNNNYYDNYNKQGNLNAVNNQKQNERHFYYQPVYPTQYQPRRTITIYEDPRDYDRRLLSHPQQYNQFNHYGPGNDQSLVHLEYKQPLNYYYYHPRPPDSYYY